MVRVVFFSSSTTRKQNESSLNKDCEVKISFNFFFKFLSSEMFLNMNINNQNLSYCCSMPQSVWSLLFEWLCWVNVRTSECALNAV